MKRILLVVFTTVSSWVAAQNPLSPALGFNVFLEKSARFTTNETDGPIAMGGNLTVSGNYQVATNNAGTYLVGGIPVSLIIGGKVNYTNGILQVNQNGYVKIGDSTGSFVWYRDMNNAPSPIRITNGNNYNSSSRIQLQANAVQLGVSTTSNPVFANTAINFSSAFTQLKTSSAVLSVCNNNVQLTTANGHPIPCNNLPSQVKINLINGVNVLNLNGADLNRASIITFNQQPAPYRVLLVNVDAPGTFNWNVWNQAGIGATNSPYIIYNFFNTTTLNINGSSTIEGTLFAPFADIFKTVNQANIEGQVIGQSLTQAGGEIHYFPFDGALPGCAVQTLATFSINKNKQCLYNNEFRFTSSAIGTAPLSYFWDFGDGTTSNLANPVKVYASAGVYTVKHRLTGLAGTDSTTQRIIVSPKPIKGFSINDSIQPLTGNLFVYTTTQSKPGYSYEWRYGDGSTYGTTVNTSRTYQATGPYFVCQIVTDSIGCKDTATTWVLVTSDSCGSGGNGGLESETLGGLVGWREFLKSKNSIPRTVNYVQTPIFVGGSSNQKRKASAELTLEEMIPATLEQGDISRITTPTDLVNITSALEVISVDYTRNNIPKAVVLGIKTKNKAYSHTKYICDRLKGANLISIDSVTIKGYRFVRYLLRQQDGSLEFGTSFVLGKTEGRSNYSLQTNWLLSEMSTEDTLFNFQVWAVTPESTDKLVGDIIDLVEASAPIEQWNEVRVPKVYVTKGYRNGSKLILHFRNLDKPTTVELGLEERLNEQAMLSQRNVAYNLPQGEDQQIEIQVNDGYEYSGNIVIDTFITDVIYFADGNWGLDYDRQYTTITRYTTSNEPSRVYQPNSFSVYRHASVSVLTDDYIMLFKGVQQGNAPANLISYEAVEFFASGSGTAELTLVRDSIVNWNDQYKVNVSLVPEGKMYRIPFTDFKSKNLSTTFSPSDVRMITFSRGYQAQSGIESIDLSLGSMSFVSSSTGLNNIANELLTVGLKPNPNNGAFYLTFNANKAEHMQLTIVDVLGKEIYTQQLSTLKGINQFYIDINQQVAKGTVLFIQLQSNYAKYSTTRFVTE